MGLFSVLVGWLSYKPPHSQKKKKKIDRVFALTDLILGLVWFCIWTQHSSSLHQQSWVIFLSPNCSPLKPDIWFALGAPPHSCSSSSSRRIVSFPPLGPVEAAWSLNATQRHHHDHHNMSPSWVSWRLLTESWRPCYRFTSSVLLLPTHLLYTMLM